VPDTPKDGLDEFYNSNNWDAGTPKERKTAQTGDTELAVMWDEVTEPADTSLQREYTVKVLLGKPTNVGLTIDME